MVKKRGDDVVSESKLKELRDVIEQVRRRESPASTIPTSHIADLLVKAVESSDEKWIAAIDQFANSRNIRATVPPIIPNLDME